MNEKELLLKEIQGLIADSQKDNVSKAALDKTLGELNDRIGKLSKPEIDSLPAAVEKLVEEQTKLAAAVTLNSTTNPFTPKIMGRKLFMRKNPGAPGKLGKSTTKAESLSKLRGKGALA